ncbi:XRE family transcriptional regulator [uncultured Algibacter sp.]|uniref:helix-turn-helix domain-containing protein n=1 Tax=uncultured Algibacter sp. TaxID=298659 RepID=UPI00260E5D96|nr:XRE family transcriptional regulator [uncultured Algibacter sp.]
MKINHSQFVFAREYRGMNQTELAKKVIGLSQSNLSKFEKGLEVLSEEVIRNIVHVLDFPLAFFEKRICNDVDSAHYRSRSSITKRIRVQLESNNKLLGYLVDRLNESVDFPDFSLISLDVEDYTPEYIAGYTRKLLGLKRDEAVIDIFYLLESSGIVVIEFDAISDKFDGVSFKTDNGIPIIIINKNFSNDRKRFSLAHELGHLLMHIIGDFPIPSYRNEKEKENEANRFAAEFLMPAQDIEKSLHGLRLSYLASLKKYWHTSKQSIIRRAKDLNCIDSERARYFMIELSRMGERKHEKTLVNIDKPVIFKNAYELHKEELNYTDEELGKAFSLPNDIIKKYLNFSDSAKLKIVM